jgi:hypothetical protein
MSCKKKIPVGPPASPFVDPSGAAQFLNCSPMWLAKLRVAGTGPAFSKNGGKIFYAVADLLQFVAQHRVTSTAQAPYHGRPRGRPKKVANRAPASTAPAPPADATAPPEPEPAPELEPSRPRKPIIDFKLDV